MDDVGIRLSLKDDSIEHTTDELIDAINSAVKPFGYRCGSWAEWEKFMYGCHREYLFIKGLEEKYLC